MRNGKLLTNYHTHTLYCDGNDSPEDMALAAIDKGFDILGFSGHSYTAFDESYAMSREATEEYRREVRALAEKYRGKIEILCGIEQDLFSEEPTDGYDFVIGSAHYVKLGNEYVTVDYKPEIVEEAVERLFGGDVYAFVERYYEGAAELVRRTNCDIIGHFDLPMKFAEKSPLFDEEDPRYRRAALKALDSLAPSGRIFEINTGAMAKGYRSAPYPSEWLLKELALRGARVMINSDCHDRNKLDFAFEEAEELALRCGFKDIVRKI